MFISTVLDCKSFSLEYTYLKFNNNKINLGYVLTHQSRNKSLLAQICNLRQFL
jgi:hypothetical protein